MFAEWLPECIQISPDGQYVAAGGGDSKRGWAMVWKLDQVDEPKEFLFRGQVTDVAFAPKTTALLTSCFDGTTSLWCPIDPKGRPTVFPHPNAVFTGSFSPDGLCIVTGSRDKTARVWEIDTGKLLAPPMHHNGSVEKALFSPDGKRIFTTASDVAQIWELAISGKDAPFTPSTKPWVTTAELSRDTRYLLTVSRAERDSRKSEQVDIWDTRGQRTDKPIVTIPLGREGVNRTREREIDAISQDGRHIFIVDEVVNKKGVVWSIFGEDPYVTKKREIEARGEIKNAVFSPDGKLLLAACANPEKPKESWQLLLWDLTSPGQIPSEPRTLGAIGCEVSLMGFSPDKRWIAIAGKTTSADDEYKVSVWEDDGGQLPKELPAKAVHKDRVHHLAFSRDSRYLASSGAAKDRFTQVVDLAPPKGGTSNKAIPLEHSSDVTFARFSQDNRYIVTVSRDQTAVVWSLPRGEAKVTLRHADKIVALADFGEKHPFSRDSPGVVTAGSDGTARLWDAFSDRPIAVFQHYGEVTSAVLGDEGKLTTMSFVERAGGQSSKGRRVEVTRWTLANDRRDLEDLRRDAQRLAGRKIVDGARIEPLKGEELEALNKDDRVSSK
jgi:WD40 repeat protein